MAGLLDTPWRYEFYQALRLLENSAVNGVRGRPLGFDHEPRHEVARLRGSPSLGFPANAIESVEIRRSPVAGEARTVEVQVACFGALGACGVLPWHYTEYVFERLSQRDRSLREFVDVLQHRSIAFLYRAWRKYRLPFAYEAARREGLTDDVTSALRGLVGLGTANLRDRLAEGENRWIYFAGLFARGQRTAAGLESMLREASGHPAVVQEFVGRWQVQLPEERSRLGGDGLGGDELRNGLGASLILGERVWDVLSGVRIRIGPIDARHLPDFAPRTGRFHWLGDLVKSYLGPDQDFEVVCVVDRSTVLPASLGQSSGARLGGSAWMVAKDSKTYDSEVLVCSSR